MDETCLARAGHIYPIILAKRIRDHRKLRAHRSYGSAVELPSRGMRVPVAASMMLMARMGECCDESTDQARACVSPVTLTDETRREETTAKMTGTS